MILDCRAGKPEGWSYLVANYVPVVRRLLAHYAADTPEMLERVVLGMRDFQSFDPAPERMFVAELRQRVLSQIEAAPAGTALQLPELSQALQPLTVVEKQAAWFESMRYDAARTGAMLRIEPRTVEAIRARAVEFIRGTVDAWSTSIVADNGLSLAREAAAGQGKDCLPAKAFLDALDGRSTWQARQELDNHAGACWHCIDHYCRLIEVIELLRGNAPLTATESAPWLAVLGVQAAKSPLWKRFTRGA